jgi:hypothetical protein
VEPQVREAAQHHRQALPREAVGPREHEGAGDGAVHPGGARVVREAPQGVDDVREPLRG